MPSKKQTKLQTKQQTKPKKAAKKTAPDKTPENTKFWAVMKAYHFSSLEVLGVSLVHPSSGPQRFVPLFETYEQALAFGGDKNLIQQVTT